jgi:ketosteroid isomerase-like protein
MTDNLKGIEEQIRQVERAWVQAHRDLDLQAIESILDDEYSQLKADGTLIGKQDLLESYASGERYWEIAESNPIRIQIMGETALLFGRWRGKGVNSGEAFDYYAYFLAVYCKRADGWKLAADASLV